MIKKFKILGERCSGTSYLEELLLNNFNIQSIGLYGHKHFFGFDDLSNTEDILFIGIVRNLEDWINSFYRNPHQLPKTNLLNVETFLTKQFYSVDIENLKEISTKTELELRNKFDSINSDCQYEIMTDRNIETNERYKNIFELRHIKNKFLYEKMPKLVKNYILITYDDLIENFNDIMNKIKNYNLEIKSNINFPMNINYYKHIKDKIFVKKTNTISRDIIIEKANLYYEKILFPKQI